MLVLSRKIGEEIVIDGKIRLRVLSIVGNQVRLGFVAPRDVAIHREELLNPGQSHHRETRPPNPDVIVE